MLQSSHVARHGLVVTFVAANLQTTLQQQLNTALGQQGEGLLEWSQLNCIDTHRVMQYLEALLENFTLGEKGLSRQLPLGMVLTPWRGHGM